MLLELTDIVESSLRIGHDVPFKLDVLKTAKRWSRIGVSGLGAVMVGVVQRESYKEEEYRPAANLQWT